MMTTNEPFLQPELMDVVRLFDGADALAIGHIFSYDGAVFENTVTVDGRSFSRRDAFSVQSELEFKSMAKRFSKLALYEALSAVTGKRLPWGALTGIRPTRLAYQELAAGREFSPLFRTMGVSEENIALTARVLKTQEPVYERQEGSCDLFVSLPFCPTKCTYCSFITAPIAGTEKYLPAYLSALEQELAAAAPLIKRLRSVYIGGGTPFVLRPEDLERVLVSAAKIAHGCEFTVEAGRPDVFSEEKLDLCKKYGVTRLCINAQSFSDRTLAAIGRKHSAEDVFRAFAMTAPYGFDLNCDLIAGLTGESFGEFANSVDTAIALSPANITVHTLCLKRGARLKEETARLKEDGLAEMIAYSREKLTAAGYKPYYLYRQKYMAGAHENVGWTKPNKACIYNIDVMEETADNLAVGGNAISKRVILRENRIERLASPKDIKTYLEKYPLLIEEKAKLFGA